MTDQKSAGAADYLAAERTFLAWIRTGLALMGLGFVVARFGLFLQALHLGPSTAVIKPYGPSFWFGTALIVLGVLVNVLSMRSHVRLIRELNAGGTGFKRPSTLAIGVALILALIGFAMAVYLISVQKGETNNGARENKAMTSDSHSGIVTRQTNHSVDETVQKLESLLQAKGVKLFALVDHSGEAQKAGLEMPPTKLLIFGNPKAGTPLMLRSPTIAIDLPLKILVWEDSEGKVLISYNSPDYLQTRHGLPRELASNIAVVEAFASAAAE